MNEKLEKAYKMHRLKILDQNDGVRITLNHKNFAVCGELYTLAGNQEQLLEVTQDTRKS